MTSRCISRVSTFAWLLVALLACPTGSSPVQAQIITPPANVSGSPMGTRTAPGPSYFSIFPGFYDGQLDNALKAFRREGRGGIKTVESNWIDSICYHAMVGESLYQLGQNEAALEQFVAALRLYLVFRDWMVRVQFPDGVAAWNPVGTAGPAWGQSTRGAQLGRYPDKMTTAMGQLDITQTLQRGGVVQAPMRYPISVIEIIRCTTLAIRRFTELMGPLAPHDPLSKNLVSALSRRPGLPNHWSEVWIDTQLGLAYLAEGKREQAKTTLERAQVAAGQFDHPLTSTVLLELGKLALETGDHAAAAHLFAESTYAAYWYPDPVVMEEAFRHGFHTHLLTNGQGVYPPLATAAAWSRAQDLRQLHVAVCCLSAENQLVLGDLDAAKQWLNEARGSLGRRAMQNGRTGARLNHLTALALYESKQPDKAGEALAAAMQFQSHGSLKLLHIQLADQAFNSEKSYTGGVVAPRLAMDYYAQLLSDPGAEWWTADPLEALAVLMNEHNGAYENWFRAAVLRKDVPQALLVADLTRRHRFLSSLDLGGRLLALRWLMEAPQDWLDPRAQLERQNISLRFPRYTELSNQAKQARAGLLAQPLAAADAALRREQSEQFKKWHELTAAGEEILRSVALRREPATIAFPPVRDVPTVQQALGPKQVVIGFFAAKKRLFGFGITADKIDLWQVGSVGDVQRKLTKLLKEMGLLEPNRAMTVDQLTKTGWQPLATELWSDLLGDSKLSVPGDYEELILVPEGPLWYMPFEALQLSAGADTVALISKIRIRCVPTLGLALADGGAPAGEGRTAVVAGKLFPRDQAEVSQQAFEDLRRVIPGASLAASPLPGPANLCAATFDRLIVLDDLETQSGGPYDWAPIGPNKPVDGHPLSAWMTLPLANPREIILPGYHTAAESALKKGTKEGAGDEIYFSVLGMMAGGTRTVLLSRWRTGGQSSTTLIREFAQELAHAPASEAWQRAVFTVQEMELDPEQEPRLEVSKKQDPPKAAHPFFWSGYLLVDTAHGVRDAAANDLDDANADPAADGADAAKEADAQVGAAVFQRR